MRGTYDSYASIDERNRSQDRSYTEHPLSTCFWSDLESEEGNLDLHDVAGTESSRGAWHHYVPPCANGQ